MERDLDALVAPRERLVDRVVDHLVDEVMEPARARRADVHARAQPDGLEALENGDVFCGIGVSAIKKALQFGLLQARCKCIRRSGRSGGPASRGWPPRPRATASRSVSSSMPGGELARPPRARLRTASADGAGSAGSASAAAAPAARPGTKRSAAAPRRRAGSAAARASSPRELVSSNAQTLERRVRRQRPVAGEPRRPRVARDRLADRRRPAATIAASAAARAEARELARTASPIRSGSRPRFTRRAPRRA